MFFLHLKGACIREGKPNRQRRRFSNSSSKAILPVPTITKRICYKETRPTLVPLFSIISRITIDKLVKIKYFLFRLNECRLQRGQAARCGSLVLKLFVRMRLRACPGQSDAGNLKTGPITSRFLG
jgi:hypothetical protein